jgi:hypothetical protein
MSNESKKHQGRVCCVPGCKNSQKKKNRELKCFVFPTRPWEVERPKKKWQMSILSIHQREYNS